jgi:L-alanine-DL-glutamate epimerase-like enolase superfamily enzyme
MKIRSVKASWVRVPIPEEQQHVSDFGRIASFDTTIVRIETECGLVGWGEAKDEVGSSVNGHALAALVNLKLGPRLVGEDPRDINRLWDVMYSGPRDHYALAAGRSFPILGRRGIVMSAISGIDLALWDLLGKSLDAPVWRLLGGRRAQSLPAYASGGWADVDGIGKQLTGYVAKGSFRAVKMRVGIIDGDVRRSVERVRAARKALGPDIGLMCDAHGTYSVAEAKRFCQLVEDLDLTWLEEPVTIAVSQRYAHPPRCRSRLERANSRASIFSTSHNAPAPTSSSRTSPSAAGSAKRSASEPSPAHST